MVRICAYAPSPGPSQKAFEQKFKEKTGVGFAQRESYTSVPHGLPRPPCNVTY